MKRIPLTQGKFALVDDEDYDFLSKLKWNTNRKPDGTCYAVYGRRAKTKTPHLKMHIQITKHHNTHIEGMFVDHINGNGLDNRKSNLRVCTPRQNSYNAKISKNNKSGFKGVSWFRRDKKWRAYIAVGGSQIHLGYFINKTEAALAYNKAAEKYFGKFAKTNEVLF